MATITVTIDGLEQFDSKIKQLTSSMRGQIAKDAVDEGAAVVQFHAQLNARNVFSENQRGQARNSIRESSKQDWIESRTTGNGAVAEIGPHVVYGRIQELGGTIRPRNVEFLHFKIDNRDIFAKSVTLPPRPYLRPAVENHIGEIREKMAASVEDNLRDLGL